MWLQRSIPKDNGVVKCAKSFIEGQLRDCMQDIRNDFTSSANVIVRLFPVTFKTTVAKNFWNRELWKFRRANLNHFCVIKGLTEAVKVLIFVAVVVFHPPASCSWPWQFFRNAFH